jgi:hypothetical protein
VREHLHERTCTASSASCASRGAVGDAQRATLLAGDEIPETLTGGIALAGEHERLDSAGLDSLDRAGRTAPAGSWFRRAVEA